MSSASSDCVSNSGSDKHSSAPEGIDRVSTSDQYAFRKMETQPRTGRARTHEKSPVKESKRSSLNHEAIARSSLDHETIAIATSTINEEEKSRGHSNSPSEISSTFKKDAKRTSTHNMSPIKMLRKDPSFAKQAQRAGTLEQSPIRHLKFGNPATNVWTKKRSINRKRKDEEQADSGASISALSSSYVVPMDFEDIQKYAQAFGNTPKEAKALSRTLDKTFHDKIQQNSDQNSIILFVTMSIQIFCLCVLLISRFFEYQSFAIGSVSIIVAFVSAFGALQLSRLVERLTKSPFLGIVLYISSYLGILVVSPNYISSALLILGFSIMMANLVQSYSVRSTRSLALFFLCVSFTYLMKEGLMNTDCFVTGYCPKFVMQNIWNEVFWISICLVTVLVVSVLDAEVHLADLDNTKLDEEVKKLVSENLDLQNQLRVAKIKPETDIAAPLTRATQLLVAFQEKTKVERRSSSIAILRDLETILGILNSDKLFEPEFFQDTGDTEMTNFLQDVLQSKKAAVFTQGSKVAKTIKKSTSIKGNDTELLNLLENLGKPFFNVFQLETTTEGHALYHTALTIFQNLEFQEILGVSERSFCQWILKMELGYDRKNAYHNSSHAADVTQVMNYFITRPKLIELFSIEEMLSCLIAAIGHDYMHPGVTNNFLIATRNPLAIRYNDTSVLEHFHASSVAEIFGQSEFDLFPKTSEEQKRYIRELVITMIMATDMSFHFEWLSKFKNKLSTNSFNFQNLNDKKLVMNIAMKCADINNLSKPLEISRIWTQLVIEEFFNQGDQEKARGLPVSMFMDRNNTDIPKCQMVSCLFYSYAIL